MLEPRYEGVKYMYIHPDLPEIMLEPLYVDIQDIHPDLPEIHP